MAGPSLVQGGGIRLCLKNFLEGELSADGRGCLSRWWVARHRMCLAEGAWPQGALLSLVSLPGVSPGAAGSFTCGRHRGMPMWKSQCGDYPDL